MTDLLKIFLIDDHPMVRKGLSFFLSSQGDLEVVGEAESGPEGLEQIGEVRPDVAVVDLVMPGMDGLEVISQLKGRYPILEILVVSSFVDEEKVLNAIQLGASGYIMKDANPKELARAVRSAARGELYLDPKAAHFLSRGLQEEDSGGDSLEQLTDRENEVLGLVTRGLSNKDIAADLNISLKTVKAHVSSILAKLGVSSRLQAALIALRQGLVTLDEI